MKKAIAVLLALLLAAAMLTACGAGPGEPTSGAAQVPDGSGADTPASEGGAVPEAAKNKNFSDLRSFTADTLGGGTFTEADFAGKDLTVINIWGTFCGPCLAEMEDLAAFEKTLPGNVRLITLCTDAAGQESTAQRILDDAGYTGITLVSWDGDLDTLLDDVMYVPTTLFYDANGNCVGTEIIGRQTDFAAAYTAAINDTLTKLGKDTI
ncbi:MAG: TlpA family protein disulfide reductase [Clostridia bacterium]|nr:TlpA family protein disulfide reductase [Clostridia bacterium]